MTNYFFQAFIAGRQDEDGSAFHDSVSLRSEMIPCIKGISSNINHLLTPMTFSLIVILGNYRFYGKNLEFNLLD